MVTAILMASMIPERERHLKVDLVPGLVRVMRDQGYQMGKVGVGSVWRASNGRMTVRVSAIGPLSPAELSIPLAESVGRSVRHRELADLGAEARVNDSSIKVQVVLSDKRLVVEMAGADAVWSGLVKTEIKSLSTPTRKALRVVPGFKPLPEALQMAVRIIKHSHKLLERDDWRESIQRLEEFIKVDGFGLAPEHPEGIRISVPWVKGAYSLHWQIWPKRPRLEAMYTARPRPIELTSLQRAGIKAWSVPYTVLAEVPWEGKYLVLRLQYKPASKEDIKKFDRAVATTMVESAMLTVVRSRRPE